MPKHNAENERVKREYLRWLKNAQGLSEQTLDIAAAAIDRFEAQAGHKDFKAFRREQAISFKEHLAAIRHPATGKPLAKATFCSTLKAVQAFFEWLSREPGYRRHVHMSDAAYFRPTDNDTRIATARRFRPTPSLEQVRHAIESAPVETVVQRRDRALVAFVILTASRDAAVASFRLKHLDLATALLSQDAREVRTKRAKTMSTDFYPVGDDIERIVRDWATELRNEHLFGPDDPLFPATKLSLNADQQFAPIGIERRPWTSAAPIRAAFRKIFEGAGLPYYGPHSLRRTLVLYGYALELDGEEWKAWSLNLGHDSVLTTLNSYGDLSVERRRAVMARIADRVRSGGQSAETTLADLLRQAASVIDRRKSDES